MKNLIKIFLSITIITSLIILSDKVNALEVILEEIFEYTIEQTAPEDLDLSFKNGTIYSDKYLKEIEEFKNADGKSYSIDKILDLYLNDEHSELMIRWNKNDEIELEEFF